MADDMPAGPLSGVRVVDLTSLSPEPYATMLLGRSRCGCCDG